MNISSSSTSTSATTYSSKGFSGLVSGLDTDALVQAMTSDVQAKIDKIKQQQQTYSWKQEAYREVITAITNFQNKYFSYTSPTNLLSAAFFNTTTMVPQGKNASAIAVSGTSTTSTPTYSITGISQLATKASMTTGGSLGKSTITTGAISFGDRTVCAAAGGSLSIKYGGSVYNVSIGNDVSALTAEDMATVLNDAMKNVTLSSGSTLGDKLAFSASGETLSLGFTGEDSNTFSISGGTTATLAALGFSAGDSESGGKITASSEADLAKTIPYSLANKSLTFNFNGTSKTITFTQAESDSVANVSDLQALLQNKLNTSFGSNKITVTEDTTAGTLKFSTDDTSTLKITSTTSDTLGATGVFNLSNEASNRLDTTKKISELGLTPGSDGKYTININGKSLSFTGDTEISAVLSQINGDTDAGINVTYLNTTGRFNITADETGIQGKVNIYDESGGLAEALFGADALYNKTTSTESSLITAGQDLKMTIRYSGASSDTDIIRSSNGVTLDGLNFTAKSTFDASTADEITFTASSETDKVVDAIKSMITDYNSLIDQITSYTETKKDTDYKPLTDAQKEEMTTEEIEKWEAKAKQGILFGDSTLTSLASSLRFVFSTVVSGVGNASSIGISTSSYYSDNGKITLDEAKLKSALESDPDKVKNLFTATSEQSASVTGSGYLAGGLSTRLKTITEAYAKSSGAYKGKLVALAGIANNTTTTDNYIARQQKILSNRLTYLQDLLTARQDRYQSKFTSLETYISKMNSQSSWLASSTS
ncbi:flagellar filament capping protein FliD [Clostridium aminobutyricum]|uniref:Flagellar hook-associated protein 2 n=1 Tax=Clostridium aminobutyricum TaxID=33953 RepID=A0A939D9K5_CLOAM|nr:flagellar filament capping protein FliD [Clostridium aminobutyricum]MBN7773717.1 flagellar filament capping protein FliD [Clostridium aminobutyricum]